ncbi:hypothetical protein SDC9_126723 [bioreactor metagenome]|uniref:DUF3788 domain-containing protein n=1 Tax=bioreactor metagenome TaxID=1076179 RepID=A0A645CS11_9ZZZZ
MEWSQRFAKDHPPKAEELAEHIQSPLWGALCAHLEARYGVQPRMEHSQCSGAPGWNVKYKKGGRALCTLYPGSGYFTCLIRVGGREAPAAELLLGGCTEYVRALYARTRVFNGSRWMMLEVTSPEILEDVKELIALRVRRTH